MRQRSLAASTRSRNAMLLGKVESQYLVGSFSPSGHSISNHSFVGSLGRMARCNVDTHTRKPRGQPFIGALPPLDDVPSARPQSKGEVLDRDRIGRVTVPVLRCPARPLARLPYQRLRLNAGHIVLSKLSDARAQLGIVAVAGVQQRHVARKTDLTRPADLFERNLRLGLERDLLRHPRFGAAIIILGPGLR